MKKLITLTALLLCAVVSTWADDNYEYIYDPAVNTDSYFTVARTDGNAVQNYSVSGCTVQRVNETETTVKKALKMQAATQVTFTTTRTSTVLLGVYVRNDASEEPRNNSIIFDGDTKSITKTSANSYDIITIENVAAGNHVISQSGKETELYYVRVTELGENTTPTLSAAPKSLTIKLTPSLLTQSETFTLTGENLTEGETVSINPESAVSGLTVTPSSVVIGAEGNLNQEVTVSYAPTADASANTVNIVASSSATGLNANVALNYSAKITPYTMESIGTSTTFNLSETGTGLADVSPDEYVLIANAGSEASFANNIAVKGVGTLNVSWRSDAIQAGYFKFNTTVPGTITVKFSDTGGTAGGTRAPRFANVNGNRSDVSSNGSSGGVVTSAPIFVYPGDIIIKGEQYNKDEDNYTDNQIRVFQIVFTAIPNTPVTVGEDGYRTFASKYPLDFTSGVVGLKAYKATVSGSTVTFSEVTGKVPAKEGLLLKAEEGEHTIPVSATEPAAIENELVGVTALTPMTDPIFVLLNGNKGIGFYRTTTAFNVGANTAYLPADVVAGARQFIGFDEEGEATGIEAIERVQTTDTYFNLNGQRVAQPSKGLYIVNGKKVVLK